ncbi:tetratricopeptide repeat protein [Embleya sp. NPDC059237]|uniref:tetratricopeptide repeat protein n=1 Tax=Embleya sp. NPDC059237 TaxID=3346784 RepID=UPI003696E73C
MTGPRRRPGWWPRRDTPPAAGPGELPAGERPAGAGTSTRNAGKRPGQWVAGSVVNGPVTQVSDVTGDVHVTTHTGAERALYRIDAFPTERAAPTVVQARAQPARLLQARYALVGFTGRRGELARLAAWRDDRAAGVSVLLVHGPGGQGKTRLAARFAADTRADGGGWGVLQARHATDPTPADANAASGAGGLGRGSDPAGEAEPAAGVLLVVDYAERWPVTDLVTLLAHAAGQGCRVRVLLVARPAGLWWQTLAHRLDRLDVDTDVLPLPPLTDDPNTDPHALFTAARNRFAAALDVPDPHRVVAPAALDDPRRFGQVLAVHMAALAAVDAHRTGTATDLDAPGRISGYLLDRERDHWRALHENRRVTVTAETLARTTYTAALTGVVSHDAGHAVLVAIGACTGDGVDRALTDHAVAYPPADPHAGTVLEPLYPDRLAEDFLALTTPGHHLAHATPDPWTTTAPTRLLHDTPKAHPDTTTNTATDTTAWAAGRVRTALTVLVAAAARWPHLVPIQLVPVLTARPDLALHAGGATLTALAALDDLPMEVLEAVDAHLPVDRHTDLDPGIAALTARLTPLRLAATTDPAQHARLHSALANRYANAGLHQQALAADRHALDIRRRLAKADPAAYEPDLAGSLNNLSIRLGKLGRRTEGLAAIEETVAVRRRLAAADPAAYEPDLAVSLNNLAVRLGEVGHRAEGLATIEEAVEVYRRLAAADPAAYEPNLAVSLNNLSLRLGDAGRRTEGLAASEEAVEVCRRLAGADFAVYEPDLASSLNNLANRLGEMGRQAEGLAAIEETVTIRRRLAAANPDAYEPDLATSLNNLSNRLGAMGRQDEGLAAIEEAVAIRRRLAAASPDAYEPNLAGSLNNLSIRLGQAGRREESLAAIEEAVAIRRRLAAGNPAAYEPDLAGSLNNLSNRLGGLGRRDEGLAAIEEAVEVCRRLAGADFAAYEPNLASSLNNLAVRLGELGRRTEGLAASEETVTIRRRVAAGNPTAYEPDLATSLNNLAVDYGDVGRPDEGLTAIEEAIRILHRLASETPAVFAGRLRTAQATRADLLEELGRSEEARDIRRRLADKPLGD